jgi:L-arabinose isomerase
MGIGLEAYWSQFDGLKQRLEGYQERIERRLEKAGAHVVSAGLIDNPRRAREAGDQLAREDLDLLICYVGTYATSSQVLPTVQAVARPTLVLNLQPVTALDYDNTDTAEWLANCSACCVPEISGAFARSGIHFNVVTGVLDESSEAGAHAWREIDDWVSAAAAAREVRRGTLGFLGHTYPGMLDMYSDFTMVSAQTGLHMELLEMDDLASRIPAASEPDVQRTVDLSGEIFETSQDSPSDPLARAPAPEELEWAARVAVALDRLVEDFGLDALAYYYRGRNDNEFERLGAGLTLGATLLTARGVPCSGEGDVKNAIAMLMMDRLGAGGSFTEFYAMDFDDESVLMGHDGPFHVGIAQDRPLLRGLGLYHGKRGRGVSVEARVALGPITLLGVTQTLAGRLKILVAEGESVAGPVLRIGNTNSRLRFSRGPAEFMDRWCEEGPTHHCALGVGHQAKRISKLARLLRLDIAVI